MPIEDDKKIKEILSKAKTIAVVGASSKPYRDSRRIAEFLTKKGYNVILVNPSYTEIDGQKCYPDLTSIGDEHIDIVDIFRKSDYVDEIVDDAITVKAETVWFQLGVINLSAARKAESAGLNVVMDHCIAVEHARLIG